LVMVASRIVSCHNCAAKERVGQASRSPPS
jgi:hypothetical protein